MKKTKDKVLVIGGGGREHAIVWKISSSERVEHVYVAPGNYGCSQERKVSCVPIDANNIETLAKFVEEKRVGLTIVGPEVPLSLGIVDYFSERGLLILGPGQKASCMESSKVFAKKFMQRHEIPTAPYRVLDSLHEIQTHLKSASFPVVIKEDGLAAGKGVIIAYDANEAIDAAQAIRKQGKKVFCEDYICGKEVSATALCDGSNFVIFPGVRDHKSLLEGGKGPNTGGMGVCCPLEITLGLQERIRRDILQKTLTSLLEEDIYFKGFLFVNIMVDSQGDPYVLEYNVRLGDPEAQVLMVKMESDFFTLCLKAATQKLNATDAEQTRWLEGATLGVVMVAEGYPKSNYARGMAISGLEGNDELGMKVFHAGTSWDNVKGKTVTNGGRVLCVTASSPNMKQARDRVYTRCQKIHWQGAFFRKDIGQDTGFTL